MRSFTETAPTTTTTSTNTRVYSKKVASLDGKEYLNFIYSIKSPATKRQYAYFLLHYMQFLNVDNPSDLIFDSDVKIIDSI